MAQSAFCRAKHKNKIMFYTYVLYCYNSKTKKPLLYIGSTDDLRERVLRHKTKNVATTKSFGNIELIYYEACTNKTDARKRELQLKTGFGRGYIKKRLEEYFKTRD